VSLYKVGHCYFNQGEFAKALPWFERAVAASEKGDVHGRVNSESLELSRGALEDCRRKLKDEKKVMPSPS
jgi:tetratricopeptide (TPR) repeat protein